MGAHRLMTMRKHRWHMTYRHLMKHEVEIMNCSLVRILPGSLFKVIKNGRNVDEIL